MDKDKAFAREKYNNMAFGGKISYLWGYYKMHLLIVLAIALMLTSFIYSNVTRVHPDLNVLFLSQSYASDEVISKLEDYLSKHIDIVNNNDYPVVSVIPIIYDPLEVSEQAFAFDQKLQVELAGGNVTLFLCDEIFLERLKSYDRVLEKDGLATNLTFSEELPELFVAVKAVYSKDQKNEKKLLEYENARKVFEVLTR